ncbi:MAG: hypothetical protein Q8Q42_03365 [Nanoarchaeota archaeon]|nr:hypothetical protein [Nanoarchaeota archaeon]
MAIYRSDQSRLSFASEAGLGGYLDYISAIDDAGQAATTLTGVHAAGSRSLTVVSTANYLALDYVQIGTAALGNAEVRRVVVVSSATVMYIDQPLGFYHANGEDVDEKSSTLTGLAGTSMVTFLPGVYETVTVPDMVPQIEPSYFLGTASNRNWTVAYRGRQTFSGSLPNFILLNGYPLRFPIGSVRTTASAVTAVSTTTTADTFKGQRRLPVTDGTPAAVAFANGDFIEIERGGTNPEVRQIISGGGVDGATTFILNYPMMFAHANPVTVSVADETGSYFYTHTIVEAVGLDSMSWHLLLRDSDSTAANDFIRRYIGGKVNRATLRADEGGMLLMSFDEVPFIDLIHNQQFHSLVGASTDITKFAGAMIAPAGIGGDLPHSGGALGTPVYPTTEPYYFSRGSLTFFGVEFARIRSFSLEVNNNLEPRYYVRDTASGRIPHEIQEQRREYRMTARVALPDSIAAAASTLNKTLFKELLLEGNYGSGMAGFDITVVFTRGTNDNITITIPPSAAAAGLDSEGAYIVRASNNIGGESPTEVDLEMIFRSLSLVIRDLIPVYP